MWIENECDLNSDDIHENYHPNVDNPANQYSELMINEINHSILNGNNERMRW